VSLCLCENKNGTSAFLHPRLEALSYVRLPAREPPLGPSSRRVRKTGRATDEWKV